MDQTSAPRGRRVGLRARIGSALAAAGIILAGVTAAGASSSAPDSPGDSRPNVVVILSDDQTMESLPHDPPVMPFLQGQIDDPDGGWIAFPNAFASTPLCCPSRASLLTGRYARHTGVLGNADGRLLDESSTLATWLHDAGYQTGLIGKYLNGYPWDRGPYVPPGWDRFVAKTNTSDATVYRDYTLVADGRVRDYGPGVLDYSTDVLAREAVDFLRAAPVDRPFFLLFSPSAPHRPWIPPARYDGAFADLELLSSAAVGEEDVSDKPAWVRSLPPIDEQDIAAFERDRRREYETLLGLDDAVRGIFDALAARGALGNTIVFYLTDNAYSLGEHRWETKGCPYDVCTRTPMFVHVPGATARTEPILVSNVDVAPSIASLAEVRPPPVDGLSMDPVIGRTPPLPATGVLARENAVFLEYAGDDVIPAWRAVRLPRFLWIELSTGERELYDLTGVLGPPDPEQLDNRADVPRYHRVAAALSALLGEFEPE